ncbi:MAG TPA: hypothetical protein VIL37_21370 [Natronosporangium sp.]
MSGFLRRFLTSVGLAAVLAGAGVVTTATPAQAAVPPVGSVVCHVGRVSGLQCGTVTAINVTISFPGGPVHGVFLYTASAQPGDSGAPIYAMSSGDQIGTVLGSVGGRTAGLPLP